jgi:tetratricopeptide (TPR) repeat protein
MVVKNEEVNLPRVLSSIQGLADEVIVVDTGSSDRTKEIALSYGAKTFDFPWCDDFSAARNESLKHATMEYILWLDGDDEVAVEDHGPIKEHLRKNPGTGVYLRVVSNSVGGTTEFAQLRIFPNLKGIAFEGKVHEQIYASCAGRGVRFTHCGARISHFGYSTAEILREKFLRNKAMNERELEENPENILALVFLARALRGLEEDEEALKQMRKVLEIANPGTYRDMLSVTVVDMAAALCRLHREQEALSLLRKWVGLLDSPPLVAFTLGEVLFKLGNYEDAYRVLLPLKDVTFDREIMPLDTKVMRLNLNKCLGVSALFAGDAVRAEQCFTRSLEEDPGNDEACHYLSLAKERRGDIEGAIRVCREGLARIEDKGFLRKRLFLLLIKCNDFDRAAEEYEALNGLKETDLEALCGIFFIHCMKLDASGITRDYSLIRKGLSLRGEPFPEGLDQVKESLAAAGEAKAGGMFGSAISGLLQINS